MKSGPEQTSLEEDRVWEWVGSCTPLLLHLYSSLSSPLLAPSFLSLFTLSFHFHPSELISPQFSKSHLYFRSPPCSFLSSIPSSLLPLSSSSFHHLLWWGRGRGKSTPPFSPTNEGNGRSERLSCDWHANEEDEEAKGRGCCCCCFF